MKPRPDIAILVPFNPVPVSEIVDESPVMARARRLLPVQSLFDDASDDWRELLTAARAVLDANADVADVA